MSRIRILIEYDGTHYAGWQRQKNALTVQEVLEDTLGSLLGQRITLFGASRTDAGVHALGQTAHFDAQSSIPPEKLFLAVNTHLPPDIRLCASEAAEPDFHARFCTRGKHYTYQIYNACHGPAILRNQVMFVPAPLDLAAMQEAAQLFVGTHDFTCAMAAGSNVRDCVRTVYDLTLQRRDDVIAMDVRGNGFLYNMVRIFAGTLICVGQHKLDKQEIAAAMAARDRRLLGFTAQPQGLFLRRVYYDRPVFGLSPDFNPFC